MGMNVRIGEDAARLVEKMVASGQYGSAEEVVEHALAALGAERAVRRGGERLAP